MLPYTTPVAQLHSTTYSKADMDKDDFVPSDAQMTSIVLPTIVFCIGMVVAMLVGINKCKQWDLDRIVEMRRTRRVVQRITARLREKNFKTIQKARNVRKRAAAAAKAGAVKQGMSEASPPLYSSQQCGSSPPPSYEDALLDEYYFECHPSNNRKLATRRSSTQSRTSKRSNPTTARRRATQQNSSSSSKGAASSSDVLPV